MNLTLYRREMKNSIRLIVILAAVMTLYISIIVSMYDPEMAELLDSYVELMPDLMAAVGMKAGATSLIAFISSYLYGFILLIFPMIFSIFRANTLVCKYVDQGSMTALIAAPVKRRTILVTQASVLLSGLLILIGYSTAVEIICAEHFFPGELDKGELLILNFGLLCLQMFISGICLFFSCLFSDTKYSLGFGAGIPILMYVLQMLANTGDEAEKARYFTFFTLFDADGIIEGNSVSGVIILLAGSLLLYAASIGIFSRKDLHI